MSPIRGIVEKTANDDAENVARPHIAVVSGLTKEETNALIDVRARYEARINGDAFRLPYDAPLPVVAETHRGRSADGTALPPDPGT